MKFQVATEAPGHYVLHCPQEVEWDARASLVDQVAREIGPGPIQSLLVDLGNVTFINSAGIGAMMSLRKFTDEAGARMAMARPRPQILRLLKTVCLPDLIPVTASLDEARELLAYEPDLDRS